MNTLEKIHGTTTANFQDHLYKTVVKTALFTLCYFFKHNGNQVSYVLCKHDIWDS